MIAKKKSLLAKIAIFPLVFSFFLFSPIISSCRAMETETNDLQTTEAPRPSYTEQAAFIAGVSTPWSPLAKYEDRPVWKQYAGFFDKAWKTYDSKQLQAMKKWASTELAAPAASRLNVFYPLSGPDFINAYTLFPRARTYILVALQPIGEIPDFQAMSPEDFNDFFAGMKESLHDILSINYFLTAHMHATMDDEQVSGVLPIMMFFLGREDAKILDIERWYMSWDGTIVRAPAFGKKQLAPDEAVEGLRILFKKEGSSDRPQTIYYFKLNLCNSTFTWNRHFLTFLKGFGPFATFMKSASFVMSDPKFSAVKRFVLAQSRYVLQDDSGIPFDDFDLSVWNFSLYGVYKGPISTFKEDFQPDLAQAYREDRYVSPLPFGIGYHWEANTSNLLLAIKN
ncbi:MAG: hypothetical protein ACP5IL_11660 [Syntrophobacteraceae bacterium]